MTGEREQLALGRIDTALARIEAAAARPLAPAPADPDPALRGHVSDALRDLDRLIRELEQ